MNRTVVSVVGVLSASGLLLVDSAVKSTCLLVLAAIVALMLRRDSAATRHRVWMLAILATLCVPPLSLVLPGWRVLPGWASIPKATHVSAVSPAPEMGLGRLNVEVAGNAEPAQVERPSTHPIQPPAERSASRPSVVSPNADIASSAWAATWTDALPLVWLCGFFFLILRLMAARFVLWNSERQGTVISLATPTAEAKHDPIAIECAAVCKQLGIDQPVILLTHCEKTIPIVWGIIQSRLLLPAAARDWCAQQRRSVLLHELAHVKRRDTTAQLLTQFACALYWFNPLVWFAAWRLGVERERACDDLVLTSGVQPSAYAGHLLEVVTGHSPVRWTQASGLAMARKSSLEGRLVAVLSKDRQRRGMSLVITALAVAITVAIAVPTAMLRAASEKTAAPGAQPNSSQQPKSGSGLKSTTEQTLKWGEPTNGLRMALGWSSSFDEPEMNDPQEFYLVVQNTSKSDIRLTANSATPNPRRLIIRSEGRHLSALGDPTPMPGDWLLKPREVALLRLFQTDANHKDEKTLSATIEEDIRAFPQYSLTAEMSIEKAPQGAWTGKLATAETRGSIDVIPPKNKEAQALYKSWTTAARATNGAIPGGLIANLAESVRTFITYNPTWETTPQLEKMLPRFDASHDWSRQDAVSLLDDLAALQDSPIAMALENENLGIIRTGTPLPPNLADAPWGDALPNGLRHAWLLEPRAPQHRLGTPLKARVLIHNAGQEPVVFRTRTWHQLGHTATNANGVEIKTESTAWLTRGLLLTYRLAPDEFIELGAPGIGIGPVGNHEDWQNTQVGTWVEAKPGDHVTLTTNPLPLNDWNQEPPFDGEPPWWLDHIRTRLARHAPFPTDANARLRLLYRVAIELFGTPVSEQINNAFVGDTTPNALEALATLLQHRPGLNVWAGPLTSAPTRFRVLPADPNAAKQPRTANGPGEYSLCRTERLNALLKIVGRPVGDRLVTDAEILFQEPEEEIHALPAPLKLEVPEGDGTWAAAWVRGETVLWLKQKGLLRKIDFTNPSKVEETRFDAGNDANAPISQAIREALNAAFSVPAPQPVPKGGVSVLPPPASQKP